MTTRLSHELKGYLLALLATFFFAAAGLIGRMLYRDEPDPLTVATIRSLLATGLMFAGLLIFRRDLLAVKVKDFRVFALYGVFGMFGVPLCFLSAIKHTTVATATIVAGTSPVVVVVLAALFLHEPLTRPKVLALTLTFAGTALMIQCYNLRLFNLNLTGIAFAFGASLSMALFTLCGKRMAVSYYVWTVIFYGTLFGTVFLLLVRLPQGHWSLWAYPPRIWFWFLLHAVFPAILADVCYIQSLRYLDASTVSIILPFQFAAAALLAFLFLGERLDGLQLLGGGLVLAGILRVQRKEHRIAHRMKNRTD